LYSQDIAEKTFYKSKVVPETDRAEWLMSLGEPKKAIHARLGPGLPTWDEPAARLLNLSGIYTSTRNVAALELPAKLFGKERFKVGDRIQFASTFYTHCRSYRVDWEGEFTLARQR